jgi:alkanesulfonate monooxygenase SsuD/methylene tetrahydromethanopterin reductase-like flavin-dependent oxidoreductase (luciferase family)
MEIGVDSFVAATVDASGRAVDPARHLSELLEAITLADQVGLDVFGIGEHHRREFLDSAPPTILAAAAARTRRIRLTSAVTVLSAADPVRVFQEFATLDLLSNGRAEIVAGRGSFIEAFPLFGLELGDYDSLFAEKLDLLLNIREHTHVHWSGKHRAALTGQGIYPRPLQDRLPVWLGVGGAGLVCSRGHTWASTNGRHHRRRTAPFSAIDRSLPRSGPALRALRRSAQGRRSFVGLRRRQFDHGRRRVFSRLCAKLH